MKLDDLHEELMEDRGYRWWYRWYMLVERFWWRPRERVRSWLRTCRDREGDDAR